MLTVSNFVCAVSRRSPSVHAPRRSNAVITAVGKSCPIERERDLEHWVPKLNAHHVLTSAVHARNAGQNVRQKKSKIQLQALEVNAPNLPSEMRGDHHHSSRRMIATRPITSLLTTMMRL